mgnify:CR=1 FL=1
MGYSEDKIFYTGDVNLIYNSWTKQVEDLESLAPISILQSIIFKGSSGGFLLSGNRIFATACSSFFCIVIYFNGECNAGYYPTLLL